MLDIFNHPSLFIQVKKCRIGSPLHLVVPADDNPLPGQAERISVAILRRKNFFVLNQNFLVGVK